ncbi:MAG: hypothetical protein ACP59X_03345 [Solidesulfovibrio sp. DCME]|uniref:hypothetical protein n=1 Tax=Solidesulfovibrio sp. DCME TaxID=3447380 RepID=UPI003D1022C6
MPETAAASLLPLLRQLRDAGGLRVFVETATGAGDVAYAAGEVFDTVITMEADKATYEAAHERLSGRKGILPLCGESPAMVPNLLPRLVAPAVFWLDAPLPAGQALPPELPAILAAAQDHVACLPGPALPEADLAALTGQAKPFLVIRQGDLTLLVPQAKAALGQALSRPGE